MKKEPNQATNTGDLKPIQTVNVFCFYNREQKIGSLFIKDEKLHFEGDLDESAKKLFETVCTIYNLQK